MRVGNKDAIYFDSQCRLQVLGYCYLRPQNQRDRLYNEREPNLKGYYLSVWQLNNNGELVALEGRGLGWLLEVSQVKFDGKAVAFFSTNRRGIRHFRAVDITDERKDKRFLISEYNQSYSCHFNYESGFMIRSSKDINK
jgi:hypothetical protein